DNLVQCLAPREFRNYIDGHEV
ncbi:hypothetical protein EC960109_4993B, partial [Escherichia coli 96.0109]